MKVLIVGSTSVIGRSLAELLAAHAIEVKLAGRREADISLDLSEWREPPITEQRFDLVIHIAADFGGSEAQDYIRAEMVNAVGTLSACSLAEKVQAKHFILLSSIFSTYSASDPYYGIYALSKKHSEEVAQFFCAQKGMDLTILRPSQVYDDAGRCRPHQELLYFIADRAAAGEPVTFYGSQDAQRNYIHLSDLNEIIKRVVQQQQTGIFTCAHPRSVRLTEMASAAYDAFETQDLREVVFMTERQNLQDLPQIDEFSLYSKIQFQPLIDIVEGYRRIKFHRENQS